MQDTLLQPPSTNRRLSSLKLPIMHLIGNYGKGKCELISNTRMVFFGDNIASSSMVYDGTHKSRCKVRLRCFKKLIAGISA